jgi:uncharacterized BrkB/YihY/UPF0761 family membrane protein
MLVFIPLWYLGTSILLLIEILTKAVLTPIGNWLLFFLIQTLLIITVIITSMKILYPVMPLKKIVNKRTMIGALIASILITICDIIIPLYWAKYSLYKKLTKVTLGLVAIAFIMKPHLVDKWKNRKNNFQIIT